MKKMMLLTLTVVALAAALTACSTGTTSTTKATEAPAATKAPAVTEAPAADATVEPETAPTVAAEKSGS